ncbi:MAG: TadE/TadG family type IV pilus assembly protein [Anaerolineae bacterium]|nr:TadE/TadG family type IV pilus assembly protein [Anaerolineae bacterium]
METPQIKQHRESGQALAEFALIFPILLMVIVGIIDFGRIVFVFSDASSSLRDAARYAEVLGFDSSNPDYVNCDAIRGEALSTRFVNNEVADVYYWDTTNPSGTPFNATLTGTALLQSAHYTCEGGLTAGGGLTVVESNGSQMNNGDILRVHYTGRIGFFTPFLSAIWSGLDLDFYAQRTIIKKLTLGSTVGIDDDFDGLDDRWEFMWWGCRDSSNNVWLVDDAYRFADISTWESWTVSFNGTSQPWFTNDGNDANDICGVTWVTDPDNLNNTVPMPENNMLGVGNTLRDFDGDGCNSGCEETRNTQPISYFGHDGTDTDRDGVSDGDEANLYFTTASGGDIYYCDENRRFSGSDNVPDGYDSDCDGVPDGVELGLIEPNDPSVAYAGKEGLGIFGYPYRPSYAFTPDVAGDGYFDSIDSDGDGLFEHEEYYDDTPCIPTTYDSNREIPTLPAGRNYTFPPGLPYECYPGINLSLGINFPTNEYLTNSTYFDDISPIGADGIDTDGDGLTDFQEISSGFGPFTFILNRNTITVTYYTHPNYADGDGDNNLSDSRTLDSDEVTTIVYGGYTDPQDSDTDGDGLSDWDELVTFNTNPLDDDSDFDNLSDGLELNTYLSNPGVPNTDGTANGGTPNNGRDLDADGYPDPATPANGELLSGETLINPNACDNMNDGYEVNTLGTNPILIDTDIDGLSDCYELDSNLDPLNPDTDGDGTDDGADCAPQDPALDTNCSTSDADGDGLPDAWEITMYGDIALYNGTGQTDGDGCDNTCEYQRGTSASIFDLFTCVVSGNTRSLTAGPDGVPDGYDTDCDGLHDGQELPNSSPTNFDTDNDGLLDSFELAYTYNAILSPLNPRNPNSDGDDLNDFAEVFTYAALCGGLGTNAADSDTDGDGLFDHLEVNPAAYATSFPANYPFINVATDPCSSNVDGDGWSDLEEIFVYTGANPNAADTDGDGIQDDVENSGSGTDYTVFDNTTCNGDGTSTAGGDGIPDGRDTDCDGLDDGDEYYAPSQTDLRDGTPLDGFTMSITLCVGQGPPDEQTITPVISLLNPNTSDSDFDGLSDGVEVNTYGSNPQEADTDGDTTNDGIEVNDGNAATDVLCGIGGGAINDDDGDGLTNIQEQNGWVLGGIIGTVATNPFAADSDGDGISDPDEIAGRAFTYTYIDTSNVSHVVTYDLDGATPELPLITNPTHLDYDGDGDTDGLDSDGDGIDDLTEINGQSISLDCDADPATVEATVSRVSNPVDFDTDGDGMPDGAEVANNTDPLDATCGPAIILAKAAPVLGTVINMYWHVPGSGTETLSDNAAEIAALVYANGFGYATNTTTRIIQIAFRSNSGCPPPTSIPDLDPIITIAGGTILTDQTQIAGNCYWVASVSIDQLITILFNGNVAEALLPADVGL